MYSKRKINLERLEAIKKHSTGNILDVGCGNGAYVKTLHGEYDIRGLDRDRFEDWNWNKELFEIGDVTSLKIENKSFDTVLAFEVLEHIENPICALNELVRVAKKRIIVTVPNCENYNAFNGSGLAFSHWTDRTHVNFWDIKSFENFVLSNGLEIIESKYINPIDLSGLLSDSFHLSGIPSKVFRKLFRYFTKDKYHITLLFVLQINE